MINYTPFGHSDWQTIVADIKKFGSAGKKTAVVSTINGDANVPFYKELGNQGVKAKDIPVVAFSVGEEELAGIDTKPLLGHLAAWNYFESIKNTGERRVHREVEGLHQEPEARHQRSDGSARHRLRHVGQGGREGEVHRSRQGDRRAARHRGAEPDRRHLEDAAEPPHHQAGVHRRSARPTASSTWCGRPPGLVPGDAWSKELDGLQGPGRRLGRPRSAATTTPRPTSAAAGVLTLHVLTTTIGRRRPPPPPRQCRAGNNLQCASCRTHRRARIRSRSCLSPARRRARATRRRLRGRRSPASPQDEFQRDRHGDHRGRGERQSAAPLHVIEALQDGRLSLQRRAEEGLLSRTRPASCSMPRPASRSPAPRRPISTTVRLNNRLRARDRCRARRPDPAWRPIRPSASRRRRRCSSRASERAAGARCRAREGNRSARQARADRGARRRHALFTTTPPRPTSSTPSRVIRDRGDQDALGLLAGLPAGTPAAVQQRRARRDRRDPEPARGLEHGAERLVRAFARLGAAARRDRPCHHLRRDGRHQHGAWRDGDARRLRHLRGAGADPHQQSRRCSTIRCSIAVPLAFLVAGVVGILIERRHHPLPLRPAAGNAARDLGPVADPAAGGAHRVRPDQQRGRQSVMDERRLRARRHHHHLQPAVDHRASRSRCSSRCSALLRFTRLGLEMRAVTQNRAMAASMGIRTARIDALTFGLGSGIAGIAGVALSQIDNVSPNLGQGYIIDSFMVVVFGGVGNLWGTLVGALHARHRQQVPRAVRRRGARQDRDPGVHHPVHPEAPARAVRAQGPGGGGMTSLAAHPRARPRRDDLSRWCWSRSASLVPLLNLLLPPTLAVPRADLSRGAVRQIRLLRASSRSRST